MKVTTYLRHQDDLQLILQWRERGYFIDEVILGQRDLSRFALLSTEELHQLAKECRAHGLNPILEWDIIMTEDDFVAVKKCLSAIDLSLFSSIRVQDVGAFHYVLTQVECSHLKIQLNLESGNHNLLGIKEWCQQAGERLERIILSIELPKETLQQYCEELPVPVEILTYGKILLFYSPRSLLKPLRPQGFFHSEIESHQPLPQPPVVARGISEESPHKGFYLIENKHGTFMFHPKEFFILDHFSDIKSTGVEVMRIDSRFHEQGLKVMEEFLPHFCFEKSRETQYYSLVDIDQQGMVEFKNKNPHSTIKGFFNTNKTDVIFKKLKNAHLVRQDEYYLGEILEVETGEYAAMMIKSKQHSLKKEQHLKMVNPKGEVKVFQVREMKNSYGHVVDEAKQNEVVFIQYVKGMNPKSVLYLHE